LLHKHIDWPQTLASLFYVNDYYQATHGDPNTIFSHTWSLAVEEQFYLLWPGLLFLLLAKRSSLRKVAIAIVLCVWVNRAILLAVGRPQGYFYEAFDTRFDHLMIGCLLAIALFRAPQHRIWGVLCGGLWKLGAAAGLLLISSALEVKYGTGYRDSIGFIADPILVAILIPQLIANRHSLSAAWMDSPPVRYLGRISYSLYLYQQVALAPIEKALRSYPEPVQLSAALAALLLVASVSYYYIERPFLKVKDRSFASLPPQRQAA